MYTTPSNVNIYDELSIKVALTSLTSLKYSVSVGHNGINEQDRCEVPAAGDPDIDIIYMGSAAVGAASPIRSAYK